MPQLIDTLKDAEGNYLYATEFTCEYFAMCNNTADRFLTHPILNFVPTCKRCAEKMENM